MTIGSLFLYALAVYVAVGAVFGIAYVLYGVTRTLGQPTTVSAGARVLLFPASAALWPLVLSRWLKASTKR